MIIIDKINIVLSVYAICRAVQMFNSCLNNQEKQFDNSFFGAVLVIFVEVFQNYPAYCHTIVTYKATIIIGFCLMLLDFLLKNDLPDFFILNMILVMILNHTWENPFLLWTNYVFVVVSSVILGYRTFFINKKEKIHER